MVFGVICKKPKVPLSSVAAIRQVTFIAELSDRFIRSGGGQGITGVQHPDTMFLGKRLVFGNGPQCDRLTVAFNFQEIAISRVR